MQMSSASTMRMRPVAVIAVLALVLALVPIAPVAAAPVRAAVVPAGATIYVDQSADGPGDGSAEDPFVLLGDGLAAAADGDTVMVAAGWYGPDSGETLPFLVPAGVTVIGEYDDDDGWQTILAGNTVLMGDVISEESPIMVIGELMYAERSAAPVLEPVYTEGVVLKDLAFIDNAAQYGAGVRIDYAEVSIDRCAFQGLLSAEGSAIGAFESDVDIARSVFAYNGMFTMPFEAKDAADFNRHGVDLVAQLDKLPVAPDEMVAQVEILPCYYGGAISSIGGSLDIGGSLFALNGALNAGGAILGYGNEMRTDDTVFIYNVVDNGFIDSLSEEVDDIDGYLSALEDNGVYVEPYGGGAVFHALGAYSARRSLFLGSYGDPGAAVASFAGSTKLRDCIIEGSQGAAVVAFPDGLDANALAVPGAQQVPIPSYEPQVGLDIDRCEFYGNDGFFTVYGGTPPSRVTNSIFAENWAMAVVGITDYLGSRALGIVEREPLGSVEGCTFTLNSYDYAAVDAQAMDTLPLVNTIIWGSDSLGGQGMFAASGVAAYNVIYDESLNAAIQEDCFSEDPEFVDPDYYDFRLAAGSPAIDAGTSAPQVPATAEIDAALPWDLRPWDVRNLSRPVDGDGDGVALYDIGAHEYLPSTRPAGPDRYATSVQISRERFGESDTVVIATGAQFADGLAGSALAGVYRAPVLLTRHGWLPQVVADEIVRLGAERAIILGGPNAVGLDVEYHLEDLGLEIERIGGADRYETAALIAERVFELSDMWLFEGSQMIFIARGDLFADALAVSPVAYAHRSPVLLVGPDMLPALTVDVMQRYNITSVAVLGGASAVSVPVENGVKALFEDPGETVERIDGANRYETAANIAEWAWDNDLASFTNTGIATGEDFADALTGGPGIGTVGGVMLLNPRATVHPVTEATVIAHADEIQSLTFMGGPLAIAESVRMHFLGLLP